VRDNVKAEGPEDYLRKPITVPFLDYVLNEMKIRFTDLHARTALGLQLVPSIIENIARYIFNLLRFLRLCLTQVISLD
jgi:hypothetical protein